MLAGALMSMVGAVTINGGSIKRRHDSFRPLLAIANDPAHPESGLSVSLKRWIRCIRGMTDDSVDSRTGGTRAYVRRCDF